MKITNSRIINSISLLQEIAKKQLPVRVSFAISQNISKLGDIIKIYDNEKQKLIEKYSVKDNEGKVKINESNQITICPENLGDWNRDLNELLDIENDIDVARFKIDLLDINNIYLSPNEMTAINYMIES